MIKRSVWKALVTAVRLRCPRCGRGRLFRGWFSMCERCAVCQLVFEREPGYFVGAIYINYAATAIVAVAGFLLLDAYSSLSLSTQVIVWSVFAIAFPLAFFRYSKSLWLALDHLFSPEEPRWRVLRGRGV